jgi:anti-sigma regulatory factor (Ser/Thr protein kinase)
VARTVVAAVAFSLDGIGDDRLEDLRIAVSEACTTAVSAHRASTVVLRCLADDERFEVHIDDGAGVLAEGPLATGSADEGEAGWGLQLIRALVDDVAYEDGVGVRLVVNRGDDTEIDLSD